MTLHSLTADRPVAYPYRGAEPLRAELEGKR